jgi:hypothetical protein
MSVSGRSLPPSPATYIFAQNHVPYVTVWAKPSMSLYGQFDTGNRRAPDAQFMRWRFPDN